MNLSLGSLFDGSGGFPLAGSLCGIEPKWASEVEPYPIAVTREHFPNMKHLGDISKINGAEVEPVDIISFGSPCQDLSVAGKRAGLKHEDNGDEETTRSGLFMEAVRIIKEMRKATNGKYPKFALWENVPGAFSSNKGEDFRIVLEELIKVVEPTAVMPAVPKKGWAYADSYCGDGWSLAYRVFDAQYWGVPQRRRRIYLVADFRDQRAQETLFERDGLRGHFEKGGTPWQTVTQDAESGFGAADCDGNNVIAVDQGGGKSGANFHPADSRVNIDDSGKAQTLTSRMGTGGGNVPMVMEPYSNARAVDVVEAQPIYCLQGNGIDRADTAGCNGKGWKEDTSYTLNTIDRPAVAYALDRASYQDKVGALCARDYKGVGSQYVEEDKLVCYGINGDKAGTLDASYYKGCGQRQGVEREVVAVPARTRYIVRRLTPTECARLQGFPNKWGHIEPKTELTTDEYRFWHEVRRTYDIINGRQEKEYNEKQMLTWYNKLHTDSSEYKMWGNGIALPTALYCMQGMLTSITNCCTMQV